MSLFWNKTLFTIQDTPITLISLLTFIGVCLLFFLLAKGLKKGVNRSAFLKKEPLLYVLSRLSYYAILFIGIYISLTSVLGIDLTGIAVFISALSVGIGFGLQSIFSNFFAGIILLIEKKVRPNDIIQLASGEAGVVVEVNIRTTLIRTSDHRKIIIPNTEMISKKLTNWTLENPIQRLRIPFSIERKVDNKKIQELAIKVAKTLPFLNKNHLPEIWLTKLTQTTQEFELVVWITQTQKKGSFLLIITKVLFALEKAFCAEGISLTGGLPLSSPSMPIQEF